MITDQFGKKWYKGNLHTHSTNSDGRLSPEEVIGLYREEGYDFLALTDHWFMGEERQEENFLLLSGAEYDVGNNVRDGIYHVVGIAMQKEPKLEKGPELQEKHAQEKSTISTDNVLVTFLVSSHVRPVPRKV